MVQQMKFNLTSVFVASFILFIMGCKAEPQFPVRALKAKDTTLVKRWSQRKLRQLALGQRFSLMNGQVFAKGLHYDSLFILGINSQRNYSVANLKKRFPSKTININKIKFISDSVILAYNRSDRTLIKWDVRSDTLIKRFFFDPGHYKVGDLTSPATMPFSLYGDSLVMNASEPGTNTIKSLRKLFSSAQLGLMVIQDSTFKMIKRFGHYPSEFQKSFFGVSFIYWDRLSREKFVISFPHSSKIYSLDISNNKIIDSADLKPDYPTLKVPYNAKSPAIVRRMSSKFIRNNPSYYALIRLNNKRYARFANIPFKEDSLRSELLLYDKKFERLDRIQIPFTVEGLLIEDGAIYFLTSNKNTLKLVKYNGGQYKD